MLTWEYIPYNGNHPWKKSLRIAFFAVVREKTFAIQVISLYKNSGQDRKCKKTLVNASRFAKFTKLFFRGWFLLYSTASKFTFADIHTNLASSKTIVVVSLYLNHYLKQDMLTWEYIPYNGNHLWKKSSWIVFFAVIREKTFAIQVISLYKNSGQDRKCKKTLANASRFAKFAKLFFRGWFPLYGTASKFTFADICTNPAGYEEFVVAYLYPYNKVH